MGNKHDHRPDEDDAGCLARNSAQLIRVFRYAVMPGFEVAAHHKLVIEKIEALLHGKIKKLAIIMPPRHGKSTLGSVLLPPYFLGRNPKANVITASYGAELSEGWGRRVRNIVSSPLFSSIFPNCRLSPDSAAMHRFETTAGGGYIATGRGGPLTGLGANLMILDDLVKDAEEARSEVICKSIVDWLAHVAFTRLHRDGRIVAISTRWSERDPMGWLLREQQGWHVLHLPAVSEGGDDPLGRSVGTPLWEPQFPLQALQSIRVAVGPAVWQCLYQGNPKAALGSIFRREWFRKYHETPATFSKIVQSWDTAFKVGAGNDYSVCTTWGATDVGYYLLGMWRDKVEFPDLKKQVALQAQHWKPHAIVIEDKASGQSLLQELKTATRFPVIPIKVDTDKTTRASAVTPFFEAGKVLFPADTPWLTDLEDELAGFPGAVHDDIVDSVSQALNYLRGGSVLLGLVEFFKDLYSRGVEHFNTTFPEEPKKPVTSRDHSLNRQAQLQIETKLRGLPRNAPAENFFEEREPCKRCGATCTIRIGGCGLHCNQCGFDDGNGVVIARPQSRGEFMRKFRGWTC